MLNQVLDPAARQTIPHTVRWFSTLAQQHHFAAVLGPLSLATAPFAPAGLNRKEQKQSGKGPPGAAGEKAGREKKAPKPDKATKKPLANGGPAGAAACWHMPNTACNSDKVLRLSHVLLHADLILQRPQLPCKVAHLCC